VASDWFDITFLGNFVHSESENKKRIAEQKLRVNDERLSSRVLNHWYEVGILEDDRPNGKGWKKFSLSELVWIQVIIKLRSFGLDLSRIKKVKNDIDIYNSIDKVSKCSLLDFYIMIAANTNIPVKFIVFESGEAHIVRQIDIDIANTLESIPEDFISIDLNKLLNCLLKKKNIKADYLNYSIPPKSSIIKQIEKSFSADDFQSVTIKVNNKDYIIDEEFFFQDRTKANALMSVLQFGCLVEKKNTGQSTYQVTSQMKIKKG
jgi:DNA-binding transcriptional MerR regulator